MKVMVGAECSPIKAGVEARSPELRLCGHGPSKTEALDSLKRGVRSWCNGLQIADPLLLEHALNDAGLVWSQDGYGIEVLVEEV